MKALAVVTGSVFAAGHLASYVAKSQGEFPEVATTGFYRWSGILVLIGFIGLVFTAFALHAEQRGRAGVIGTIGLAGAVTGTVLMAGDWWFETFAVPFYAETLPQMFDVPGAGWLAAGGFTSYLTFALGWAVLGFACLRAGSVSTMVGVALIVGGLIGFGAVMPPYGIAIGLALIWAGLASRPVHAPDPALV